MWWAKKLPLNAMAIELSQHLREKKNILNNILAPGFEYEEYVLDIDLQ